jgi:hypothetical protein
MQNERTRWRAARITLNGCCNDIARAESVRIRRYCARQAVLRNTTGGRLSALLSPVFACVPARICTVTADGRRDTAAATYGRHSVHGTVPRATHSACTTTCVLAKSTRLLCFEIAFQHLLLCRHATPLYICVTNVLCSTLPNARWN